jgi:hypothetical protein
MPDRLPHTTYRAPFSKLNKLDKYRTTQMYISGIIQYLIWPVFILLNWYIIKYALTVYEKKFPEENGNSTQP